jgi:two-component system chemotaxis response regulator CheB
MPKKIKVLVVDDSAVMRRLISSLLGKAPDIEVVATAIDGDFALNKIEQFRPDVVTLDVDMPRMDGMQTLEQIVNRYGIPVLMLSSLSSQGASLALRAIELGAFDFICKPRSSEGLAAMAEELMAKVRAAAAREFIRSVAVPAPRPEKKRLPGGQAAQWIVAIGASSGGPSALRQLLPGIPPSIRAGIVIVQHLPESFTPVFVRWLDEACQIEVKQAEPGDQILPGRALVAPGGLHMLVRSDGRVVLDSGKPVSGHRPSIDVLFRSVAREYRDRAIGVIMTGMGDDGADAIGEIRRAGGLTLAQDRDSSVVFGMPRAAIERGNIVRVVPLSRMASEIISAIGGLP